MTDNIITESITGNLKQGGTLARCYVEGDSDAVQRGDSVRLSDPSGQYVYLIGNVLDDPSIQLTGLNSRAVFTVGTANYLSSGRLQAIGFTEQASPVNSHQITPTMRFSSMVQHILEAHSNLIYNATSMPDGVVVDTDYDTGNDVAIARYNVRESNDFWGTIVNNLSGGEQGGIQFYRPYFTKLNGFRYKAAPHFRASSITSKGILTKDHILNTMQITQNSRRIAQAQIATIFGNTLYAASYPANPLDGEIFEITRGVYADSQARTDGFAEGLYKWLSRRYTVRVEVRPDLLLHERLDIADKVQIDYDGPAEDTITGQGFHINFDNHNFIVYGYDVQNDPINQTAKAFLDLESVE